MVRKVPDDQDSHQYQHAKHCHPARPRPGSAVPTLAEDVTVTHGATATITLTCRPDDTSRTACVSVPVVSCADCQAVARP